VVPIEDTIKVIAAANFEWDENGNLTVNNVNGAAITSSGVMTANSLQIDDTTGDHQYVFIPSELAANRNVTLPLLAAADEVVFKDHAATMTDKTLGTGTKITLGSDADGDIYYRNSGVLTRLAKGSDGQILELASGVPAWTTPPLTESFTSAEQTITTAGTLALAHSLSSTPYLIIPYLICKTAEQGYSIGDEVKAMDQNTSTAGADGYGMAVWTDGTNISCRFGSAATVFLTANKTTGVTTGLVNANWKLIIKAWA
jgi:hypothetical protein